MGKLEYLPEMRSDPSTAIPTRIVERIHEAEGIVSLTLKPLEDAVLPAFTAGAHVDVHLPGAIVRQYSLCSDPADRSLYRLAVLREPKSRGGSAAVHNFLKLGDEIRISAPRNNFPLEPTAKHTVLLAGGIGITPMLSMCHELYGAGRSFELHYYARSRLRAAFLTELGMSPFADAIYLHFDDESGTSGPQIAARARAVPPDTHFAVCGPSGFIKAMSAELLGAGWPHGNVHVESFEPIAPAKGEPPFKMILAQSGVTIDVGADETAADALLREGHDVALSCEQGVCGTCIVKLISGDPDHRDFVLTHDEREKRKLFTPCCSRSFSDVLVVDL